MAAIPVHFGTSCGASAGSGCVGRGAGNATGTADAAHNVSQEVKLIVD